MSSASLAVTAPIAKPAGMPALASALPADLSHTPILGILAVNMGAGIATLAARFLSLGLADLRGHLGIGLVETQTGQQTAQKTGPADTAGERSDPPPRPLTSLVFHGQHRRRVGESAVLRLVAPAALTRAADN